MHWNFWRDAHRAVSSELAAALRPKWSRAFVAANVALGTLCAATAALHVYALPGRTPATALAAVAAVASIPVAYLFQMVRYPATQFSNLKRDLQDLQSRLVKQEIEDSSIVALSEYLAEMKHLQSERVRHQDQFESWADRFRKTINSTYVILSKGVSSNVAMAYISCSLVDTRYISGCFNDEHMKLMFALQKYVDKLQAIIDGHYLTSQHIRLTAVATDDTDGMRLAA